MSAALRIAQIGPNAITQVTGAMERELGRDPARDLLRTMGFARYVDAPSPEMVDEIEVIALHTAVRDQLPAGTFHSVEHEAGRRMANYLLAQRIPASLQRVMRLLPSAWASRLLLWSIARHAGIFTGSGRCAVRAGRPAIIIIEGCAICCGAHAKQPQCDYYAAAFARLFEALVDRRARAIETECIAAGARVCRFQIDWDAGP